MLIGVLAAALILGWTAPADARSPDDAATPAPTRPRPGSAVPT